MVPQGTCKVINNIVKVGFANVLSHLLWVRRVGDRLGEKNGSFQRWSTIPMYDHIIDNQLTSKWFYSPLELHLCIYMNIQNDTFLQ